MFLDYTFAFLLFALTLSSLIGGENGSTTMAPSHSAGVLNPRLLTILSGIAIMLGALLIGKNVAITIGKKLVPPDILKQNLYTLCYYVNSSIYIALAIFFKVPIATTHMVTLTVVSIGIHTGELNSQKFFNILKWWLFTPTLAFVGGFLFEKYIYFRLVDFSARYDIEKVRNVFKFFVVASGTYFAFSAGANNLANSMGVISVRFDNSYYDFILTIGSLSFGFGAVLLSPRILRAVGEKIFKLGILRASVLQVMEGTIILFASILGIPVSINETITSGIIGISCAREGFRKTLTKRYIVTIFFFWFIIPWIALGSGLFLCWFLDLIFD